MSIVFAAVLVAGVLAGLILLLVLALCGSAAPLEEPPILAVCRDRTRRT